MSNVALLIPSARRLALLESSWVRFSSQCSGAAQKVASASIAQFSLALRRSAEPGCTSFWRQLRSRRRRCRAWQSKRSSKEHLKQAALNTGARAKRRTQYELKIAALAEEGTTSNTNSKATSMCSARLCCFGSAPQRALTPSSRGQPTAAHVCVLCQHLRRRCLPLMSNVRRHTTPCIASERSRQSRKCNATPARREAQHAARHSSMPANLEGTKRCTP
jgi:hypothetical protein